VGSGDGQETASKGRIRSLGRGEGKPGYLEVSDPEAADLTVPETVRPGEIFLREHTRGFLDLLRQNPVSLFMLFGWSSISMASIVIRSM
jgi:hypothetical protein